MAGTYGIIIFIYDSIFPTPTYVLHTQAQYALISSFFVIVLIMIMVIIIISIIMVVVMEKKILLRKTTFASFLHFSASFISSFDRAFTFRDIFTVIAINLFNVMITINITQTQDLRNIKRPWPAKSWTGSLPTPHADQPGRDVNRAACNWHF